MNTEIDEPIDLIRTSLGKNVLVKCRNDRELRGRLHAYDPHLNLLLSDVEEKITHTKISQNEENTRIEKKNFPLLYLRGDLVIVVVPTNK